MPSEIESLVEAVYGSINVTLKDGWSQALDDAKQKMELKQYESEKVASRLLVAEPGDPFDLIEQFNQQLDDDEDPEVHEAVRAATREGDPSVTIVFINSERELNEEPTVAEVREMLDCSAKLNHRGLYQEIIDNGVLPERWKKNAHLRYARLLQLDKKNQARVGGFTLTVDEDIGIVIDKDGEDDG
jgi:CRISPR-associated endonuclease/helicase Cas3